MSLCSDVEALKRFRRSREDLAGDLVRVARKRWHPESGKSPHVWVSVETANAPCITIPDQDVRPPGKLTLRRHLKPGADRIIIPTPKKEFR